MGRDKKVLGNIVWIKLSFISAILFLIISITGCERVDNPFGGTASGGVVVSGGPLSVDESGTTDSFTVVLDTHPGSTVKICLNSSDTGEAAIQVTGDVLGADTDCSDARIEFNSTNWNTPQTVSVAGVEDAYSDGDKNFAILLQNIISSDSNYAGVKPSNVSGTTIDNEGAAGINMTPASGLIVEETGLFSTGIWVSLNTQPENNVKICLASDTPSEAAVFIGGDVQGPDADCPVASIQFGFSDWSLPKGIYIQGVRDSVIDADQPFSIITTNVSLDPVYSMIDPVDPTGINYNSYMLYTWTQPTGTVFSSIIGSGTDVWNMNVSNTFSTVNFPTSPTQFTFNYDGTGYTSITITTEGTAILGTPSASTLNQDLYTTSTPHILLAPWWDDLQLNYTTAPNGRIQYLTTGTAPNRVFTIEWNNINVNGDAATLFTFQVKLYEGSDVIEFVYDTATLVTINSTASIGIKGDASVSGVNAPCYIDGLTGSSNTPGSSTLTAANFPAGTVITFTP